MEASYLIQKGVNLVEESKKEMWLKRAKGYQRVVLQNTVEILEYLSTDMDFASIKAELTKNGTIKEDTISGTLEKVSIYHPRGREFVLFCYDMDGYSPMRGVLYPLISQLGFYKVIYPPPKIF